MKFIGINDKNETSILQKRQEFESDFNNERTIQIYGDLCRDEEADDDVRQNFTNQLYEEMLQIDWLTL